ncbi:MAG: SAM-dependent methyltransferase [Emcibacter sp.]|nr:SAM-dependent methyltransferase [Emcibacter sp.]
MNTLETYLIQLIKTQGPISMALFMAEALGNEKYGYYMKQDPFGHEGDFTTAPEISQMFGEMLGLWHVENWINMDSPKKVHLIELGPGRGTLMQDMLRTMKIVPNLMDAVDIHLVEMSPHLKKVQEKNLKEYKTTQWHNRLGSLLDQIKGDPVLIIANEFFDALPVRQFEKTETGWHERLVCVDEEDKLCVKLAPVPSPDHIIPLALQRSDIGSITEICSVGENIMSEICEYIPQFGGAALIIDYGYDHYATGDTLQAVRKHKFSNIFTNPGDADLTCHVNFQKLKEIALHHNIKSYGPLNQGSFLKQLGIESRAEKLLSKATETQKTDILSALHRLTHDSEMGKLFKVLALTDLSLGNVAGFER